ncbi:hypothetical protein D3C86_1881450 [compost metagenome]
MRVASTSIRLIWAPDISDMRAVSMPGSLNTETGMTVAQAPLRTSSRMASTESSTVAAPSFTDSGASARSTMPR